MNSTLQDIRGNRSMSRVALVVCLVIILACVPIGVWWAPMERVPFIQFVIEKAVILGGAAFGVGKAAEEFGAAVKGWVTKVRGSGTKEDSHE